MWHALSQNQATVPMAFRQHNKHAEAQWLRRHRHQLLCAGVPAHILDANGLWSYMLWHGAYDDDLGWAPTSISVEDAMTLLELLEAQHPEAEGPMLIRELRRRLGRAIAT